MYNQCIKKLKYFDFFIKYLESLKNVSKAPRPLK